MLASVSLDVSSLAPAPLTQLLLVFLLSSQDQLLTFIHCSFSAITGLNHFVALATFSFPLSFSSCFIFVFSVIRWNWSHARQVCFSWEGGWNEVTERLEAESALRSIGAGTSLLGDRRLEGQSSNPWEQLSGAV